MQEDLEESEKARSSLKANLTEFEEKTIMLEQEQFEMETTQLELVNNLKEVELQNESLEDKINQLLHINEELEKNQAIYIARKHDKVDQALGNFLNKYPEKNKLQILFLRESEGVYQFG